MKKFAFAVLFITAALSSFGQPTSGKYKFVDETVQKLGALSAFNVAVIADTITAPFPGKEEKARAIFYWIANNIALDPKATKQNDPKNTLPEKVIELRKATPLGFSLLLQEMCSAANIRCISVDGYTRNYAEEINDPADEINHAWNVVQLGQSPETWFLTDAARAGGFLDKKMTVFTKRFTSEYFFADKKLFNLSFFPKNDAWQLGGGVKNLKEFYALPIISNAAFAAELSRISPLTGLIKTKLKNPVVFSFRVNNPVRSVTVITGEGKKQSKPEDMNFEEKNGLLSFSYKFKQEDTTPLTILVDGKEILQYMAEVSE
ncbi:MAG: transglutaminase domain-containing protein [Ferruginibacter sp.]